MDLLQATQQAHSPSTARRWTPAGGRIAASDAAATIVGFGSSPPSSLGSDGGQGATMYVPAEEKLGLLNGRLEATIMVLETRLHTADLESELLREKLERALRQQLEFDAELESRDLALGALERALRQRDEELDALRGQLQEQTARHAARLQEESERRQQHRLRTDELQARLAETQDELLTQRLRAEEAERREAERAAEVARVVPMARRLEGVLRGEMAQLQGAVDGGPWPAISHRGIAMPHAAADDDRGGGALDDCRCGIGCHTPAGRVPSISSSPPVRRPVRARADAESRRFRAVCCLSCVHHPSAHVFDAETASPSSVMVWAVLLARPAGYGAAEARQMLQPAPSAVDAACARALEGLDGVDLNELE